MFLKPVLMNLERYLVPFKWNQKKLSHRAQTLFSID